MEKETLSNKVRLEYLTLDIEEDIEIEEELVLVKDIIEFIKDLKIFIDSVGFDNVVENIKINKVFNKIDKLAGDKLI